MWRVRVEQRGDATRCRALSGEKCSAEEVEMVSTPPPMWAMRTLLFFPFPMRLEADTDAESAELGCVC